MQYKNIFEESNTCGIQNLVTICLPKDNCDYVKNQNYEDEELGIESI